MKINHRDPFELAKYIKNSKKKTQVKVYIDGKIKKINFGDVEHYKTNGLAIAIGEWDAIERLLFENEKFIRKYFIENNSRNSAVPLLNLTKVNARIEPGAIVRSGVEIEENAVIMMGAVVNIGASIGAKTMVDMNAVIGARAFVGKSCHIGAGAVIAGVLEPAGARPVVIGDNVLIGANAVVLEGIKIGNGAVVGALSVVTKDVPENAVVVGSPAVKVKGRQEVAKGKIEILEELR